MDEANERWLITKKLGSSKSSSYVESNPSNSPFIEDHIWAYRDGALESTFYNTLQISVVKGELKIRASKHVMVIL